MARAVGLGSQFRGKLGSYVGYLVKNRRGRYVQAVKSYQPIVSNPQTFAQVMARIPLGPTQRFYNRLAKIIQRGFEGVEYGEPSKSEFLSLNLSDYRGPYLTKTDLMPRPGPFILANGSLGAVNVTAFYNGYFVSSIMIGIAGWSNVIGDISSRILRYNNNYQVGDQITFVFCVYDQGEYVYGWKSIILDPTSTDTCDWLNKYTQRLGVNVAELNHSGDIYGAAVIRSRSNGDAGHLRSYARMELNPAFYQYNDEAALRAAVLSYMDDGADSDEWPFDPIPEENQISHLVMVDIIAAMVDDVPAGAYQGKQCLGYVTKGAEIGVFYKYDTVAGTEVLLDGYGNSMKYSSGSTQEFITFQTEYQPSMVYQDAYGALYT